LLGEGAVGLAACCVSLFVFGADAGVVDDLANSEHGAKAKKVKNVTKAARSGSRMRISWRSPLGALKISTDALGLIEWFLEVAC
jgi:hypothetical protein